ncbi:MAG: nickel-dependent hydrogenase large subunit [Blastocatellia bacterium]|nr:nickel-dependent hydrogenase large subunit [Blastocatellia bacterium]
MAQRIVVDPITRIEGHLRIQAMLGDDKVIADASSTSALFRGIEIILKGRDPRDAWALAERICGVCTLVHAITSVRAVEDALGIVIPKNANTIRNQMIATLHLHDHVVHFYHLHALDWVDVVSALKADPKATSELAQKISRWPKSSPGYFADTQNRLKKFVESGQLGIFANGYWGHPAYKLPPEANLMAVAHYLEMLAWQKEIVKIHAVFGGKNPHPNLIVGGVPCAINPNHVDAINIDRLSLVKAKIDEAVEVTEQVYYPDLLAIASFYKDWAKWGGGLSNKGIMDYGDFPTVPGDPKTNRWKGGAILNGNLQEVFEIDPRDPSQIQEYISHSWFEYSEGEKKGYHPWDGETTPKYQGPKPPWEFLEMGEKYSWMKAPRWKGHAMEGGPLSRTLLAYAQGDEEVKSYVDEALKTLDVPFEALYSTLGRTLARGIETRRAVRLMQTLHNELIENIKAGDYQTASTEKWDPSTWPSGELKGVGTYGAPRGALAHWVKIRDRKISNYQCVVATTWNGSPKDPMGQHGPFEASLIGLPVHDPKQPLEILRVIHSFDPCLACSTHVLDMQGNEIVRVDVQ